MQYVRDLDSWVPVTKLYRSTTGTHYAVSVIDYYTASGTEVFLADEHGTPIDADGDPANGLTPIARFPAGTTHDEAVKAVGYDLKYKPSYLGDL